MTFSTLRLAVQLALLQGGIALAFVALTGLMAEIQNEPVLPSVLAIEEGGDEGGGQQESPPAPASTTADTEAASGNGGTRGHETVRLQTIAWFSLTYAYGIDPETLPADDQSDTFEIWEIEFLCSMKRIRVPENTGTFSWFPQYLAALLGRPVRMVTQELQTSECEVSHPQYGWVK